MKRLVALAGALVLIAAIVYGLTRTPVTAGENGSGAKDQQNNLPLLIKVVPSPTDTYPPFVVTPGTPFPVCTLPICQEGEVYYFPPGCPNCPNPCGICATVTPESMPVCTPPACGENEVYYCPGDCPGGCGTTCATVTPAARP
jgi:hypothetical protein